jgi:hypothetical protein
MLLADMSDHELSAAAPTAQNARQQRTALFGGSHLLSTISVVRHHLLDRLTLFPGNVTLMSFRYQSPPNALELSAEIFDAVRRFRSALCCLAVGIGTGVRRIAQGLMDML